LFPKQGETSVPIINKRILQYKNSGKKGECEIVIGVDFGTSSSKVVIQAPDLPGQPSYAVNFEELAYKSMSYLLPTRLFIFPDGTCCLDRKSGSKIVKDIKVELLTKEISQKNNLGSTMQNYPPEATAAAYIALLLQYSRNWFLKSKKDIIRQFSKFIWSFNLGVPSPCIEDNEENRIFRRVGIAAWMLSVNGKKNVSINEAKLLINNLKEKGIEESGSLIDCDFEIIPEIAAGAVGYALSDMRRSGLHVMIDIGNATIDACTFLLNTHEDSDRYSILIADVKQLGISRLYMDKINALRDCFEKKVKALRDSYEPLNKYEDNLEQFRIGHDQVNKLFTEYKEKLKKDIKDMLHKIIWQTRLRRDPINSIWEKGRLPVILIGGGSSEKFFRSIVENIGPWLKEYTFNNGIKLMEAQFPTTLTESDQSNVHQYLAVAWGLSHRSLDIGEIIPADRISDVEGPKRVDYSEKYVRKEDV